MRRGGNGGIRIPLLFQKGWPKAGGSNEVSEVDKWDEMGYKQLEIVIYG